MHKDSFSSDQGDAVVLGVIFFSGCQHLYCSVGSSTHKYMHTHHTRTHTHHTQYTHTCVYKQDLTTQQMPPSPAPIMASTRTRAVSPTASGMYWAAAGRRGEDERERREVQGSMKEHLLLKNGHMSVLIPEPLTSESCNRRTPSTPTCIIVDWSHVRATVQDSTVYGYNRSWLQHTTLTLPAEKRHSRTKMMLMYTLRGL